MTAPTSKAGGFSSSATPAERSSSSSLEPERPRLLRRSLATTAWPVEPSASAGFLLAGDALVPWGGVTAFAPLYFSAGPTLAGRLLGTSTGTIDVVEGLVGLGLGLQGHLGEIRTRASVLPGLLWSRHRMTDDGHNRSDRDLVAPVVLVPFEGALPLGGGVSVTGTVEPALSPAVTYLVGNDVAYTRPRLFVFVGVGLDVGGPLD